MKFLVTGGAGFIGHNVVRQLEQQGHSCFILDNLTTYGFVPKDEMNYLAKERMNRIRASVHRLDLRDDKSVKNWFLSFADNADAVIHLASFPRQKVVSQDPIWGSEVMSTGLVRLLELTKSFKIPKFVYISSSMVYGDFNNDVTEDSDCNPQGQYGIMKYMGEQLVKDYNRRGCFDYSIIRPSAVYGEWDVEDRVVSKFMLGAMRNETLKVKGASEVLDFTYVEDTAQGIVRAATMKEANGHVFNITRADTKLYTLLDAANIAIKIAGKGQLEVQDKDNEFPSRGRLSIDKAIQILGYQPTTSVEQGFEKYHQWFKDSEFWKTKI
jgi:nucleoside-diphosphate-sugar epimerase